MKSFADFLTEEKRRIKKLALRKHIHEYEHHTKGPHGDFADLDGGLTEDVLVEKMSPEESDSKVRSELKPKLQKMWDHYGPADEKPANNATLKQRINNRFDELSRMHPKDRAKEFSAAKKRMGESGVGHPVKGNQKTDTAAEIKTKHGPKGQIPLGMAFSPDHAHHYTSPDASTRVSRNVCAGSTSACRSACLAKHGHYGFIGNQAAMQARTQRLTHNEAATKDHATLVYHALDNATKMKKGKEGKSVLMRGSVTDDTGHAIHADAIHKHFGPQASAERHPEDKVKRLPVETMAYTKISGTEHNPEKGTHAIYSDSGPMVKRDRHAQLNGLERENIQRRKVMRDATVRKGMASYTVFNRRRPAETVDKNSDEYKNYKSDLGKIKTVRRYEPLPSQPKQGEGSAYHHPDGYGRVEHEGKSYRYQDHPVAQPVKDVNGNHRLPAEHDSRNADYTPVKHKSPEGHTVGHVVTSYATASNSNDDLNHSGFFHHVENVDHSGVYHDGHPAEMAKAGFGGVKKDDHKTLVNAPVGGPQRQRTKAA